MATEKEVFDEALANCLKTCFANAKARLDIGGEPEGEIEDSLHRCCQHCRRVRAMADAEVGQP